MINLNDIASGKLLSKLLTDCKAKNSSRYALNSIGVDRSGIAATDGRCLVVVKYKDCIEQVDLAEAKSMSLQGDILIDGTDLGRFPKYQDIMADHSKYTEGLRKINIPIGNYTCKGKNLKKAIDSLMQDITIEFKTIIDRIDYIDKQLHTIFSLQDNRSKLQSITLSNTGPKSPLNFTFTFNRLEIVYIVMPICGRKDDYTLGDDITPRQLMTEAV